MMNWREMVAFAVLWGVLLASVLAEDSSKDDGIPSNEVSPLANLFKPRLGKLFPINAHQ